MAKTTRTTKTLAGRLREARGIKGVTQARLGELSNTNQAVIQKIENGHSLMPRGILGIAEVLEVNPAWLMFGDDYASKFLGD